MLTTASAIACPNPILLLKSISDIVFVDNVNINEAEASITAEICGNGLDDDGDNLIDCADPDCYLSESASTDVPKSISATTATTVTSVLNITESGTIEDLNIKNLDITHTWIDDVVVRLISPANTTVVVLNQPCNGENNIYMTLDDEASTGTFPCPPIDGQSYQPSNLLSAFDGEEMNGTWTLTVQDVYGSADGGSLDGWSLEITKECVQPEICDNGIDDDGDGLVDCEDGSCSGENYCQGSCNSGNILVERWLGISGSLVSDLTSNANYPNSPSEVANLTNFQGPENYAENYGSRVRAYIIPSETGTYSFNVTGDDNTILYLSSDVNETNKTEIASVTDWCGISDHTKYPSQTSSNIVLQENVWYYIELLHKEGGGGDHFQVYWKTPSVPSTWNIIPGSNLAPYACSEICGNGIDDDGDGAIDDNDPNCFTCLNGSLLNPDFEDGLTNWDNYGNTSAQVDIDGNTYAHITGGSGGFGQILAVNPGAEVVLTFKAKKSGIVSFDAGISFLDASLNIIGVEHSVAVNTDVYQEYSVTFTAPANTAYVKAFAFKDDTSGSGSLDGFCLNITQDEICDNGIDDDGDGFIDCGDSDCSSCIQESCSDGVKLVSKGHTTAVGAGASGIPSLNGFEIPEGNNRIVFIVAAFERDHCQGGDDCTNSNTSGVGTGDNYAGPNFVANAGTNMQITSRLTGPGGTIDKMNPLLLPDGDLRFGNQYGFPTPPESNPAASHYSRENYFIAYYESEINTLLGGASSGTVDITLPDVLTPLDDSDEAILAAYTFINASQDASGIVRSGSNVEQNGIMSGGLAGNYTISIDDLDDGQEPDDPLDGLFLVAMNGIENYGFSTASGFTNVDNISIVNTSSEDFSRYNESDGCTMSTQFRSGPSSGILNSTSVQSLAPSSQTINGGMMAVFTIEYCPIPEEICDNGIDDDGDGLIDCEDGNCSENSTCIECNMLENTEFNNNTAYWELSNTTPATASFSIDNTSQLSGENSAFIDITNSTGTDWNTQFRKSGTVSIDVSKTYDISFEAKATANKVIRISLQQAGSPYTTYYTSPDITLTTTAQTHTISNFTVPTTATDAVFKFFLGIDDSDVWLDNIILEESSCTPFEGFDNEVCYFISDGLSDENSFLDTFYTFNYVTSAVTPIGPTGTYSIEAMAMDTINEVIYAVDSDEFGVVNPTTGSFSVINTDIGDVNGAEGVYDIDDVDGMTFDHTNNIIWATERRDGGTNGEPDDLLFQINPANGNPIANAFGAGIDYVVVSTPENDIDDIALADDGTLYAISNYGGSGNQAFGIINKTTGAWTEIGDYGVEDVESLAFTATGQLVATTGKDGSDSEQLYTIDAGTGLATFVGSVLPAHDVEACDCISANLINLQIGDKVWADINNDGIQDIEEPGVSGVTVNLLTSSGSPYLDGGSPVTTITDALGNYIFDGLSQGQYMVEFVLPSGTSFSPQDAGADDERDSDVNVSNGRTGIITLSGSVNDLSVDAGLLNANVVIRDCSNGGELFVADDSGNIKRYEPSTGTFIDDFIVGFDGPIEMVVGSDDWLYVSNSNANSIDKYSLKTGVLIESITDKIDDPHGMTIGPDGNIYINNDDKDEVLKLDVATGTTSVFVSSAAGGLDGNKWGIEFGPDGNLYVTSFYTDEVIRYNGTTGAFIDIFVTANESNCNAPSDLTFGPDGNLYVAGKYNDKVAQYNGTTGAYMGGFVTYQSGGLQDPVHVNFGGDGYLYVSSQSNQVGVLKYNATTGTYVENLAAAPGPNGILFAPVPDCAEICDNGFDDDGNGLIDCLDGNCIDNPTFQGDQEICIGETTTLSPNNGGTWTSNNSSIATITNTGLVTGVSDGSTFFTFTNDDTGCSSTSQNVTVYPIPSVSVTGPTSICEGFTSQLSPTSGGTWTSNNTSVATVNNAGVVMGVSAGSTTFVFTNSTTGCSSDATIPITVNDLPTVSITGPTSVCEGLTTQLSPSSGGTWTSNNTAIATVTNSGVVTGVSPGSTTFVFTNNSTGCVSDATQPITVNGKPTVLVTGATSICEGFTSQLSPTSGGTWSSNNTSVATVTNGGVVTGVSAGSTTFVFTNSTTGCSSDATIPITVNELPTVSITGPGTICEGESTTLSPSSGGTWTSSNNSVATVTNGGIVTGVSAGDVSFTFTDNTTMCTSEATATVTIIGKTEVAVTGPTSICEGFTSQLTPTSGGTWMSNDPSVATVTNGGVVTGISPGSATFVFTNTTTGCVSDNSQPITVNEIAVPEITGPSEFCVGSTTTLTPSMGGTWVSSDTMIATVSNDGIVTGVAPGTASFTFTSDAGCVSDPTADITVDNLGLVTITGDPVLCIGEETTLEASTGGGTWLIDNPSVATITSSGVVTAISAGTATVTYDHNSQSCPIDPTFGITVNETPVVSIDGATSVCVGENTQLSTTGSGGSWSSSDENIAIVSSSGLVVGVSAGVATFTYTNSNGCESEASGNITVDPEVEVSIDFNGSLCLEDDSQLSAIVSGGTTGFTYSWTGPNGFTGSTQTISIVDDGNYNVTVTDSKGCTASTSAFVYEAYEPFIFTLNSEVCEGEDVTLSVNGGSGTTYQWGPNAGNATSSSVTVTPGVPSTTYFVTVTNSIGCSTTASATIDVIAKPVVSITGSDNICIGTTTQLSPSSGGTWTSSDYSVANVDNNGVVTGLGSGTATFTFKDGATDCYSDPTEIVTVSDNDEVTITGDDQLCIGVPSMLTSSVGGGTWSSSNETVVTIDANTGEVNPNVQGSATITYTPPSGACYAATNYNVNVYNSPVLSINGPSTICEGDITYVTSNTTGTWTSSDESIAIVSVSGEVTGVGPGTVYFSFVSSAGCTEDLDSPITIIASPEVSITGPSSICISGTTTLSPTSGGVWISNNTSIATVNSSGVVTGVAAGNASFTFIESNNGCVSDNNLVITVEDPPAISAPANNLLCIDETTTITPTTGGSWSSSNPGVATISNEGLITAISSGQAVFTFTSDLTGCQSLASSPVTVQNKPSINFTGPTEVCPDETSTITPSSGGFWTSTDVSIAIITNQGNITAVSPGTVRFIFTDGNTGCVSDSSQLFTVTQPSVVSVTGPSQICIGETTTVSPSSGGTWSSSDANIATVNNAGIVTAIAPGTVTFTFVDATGCSSEATTEVFVDPGPTVSYLGSSSICIGETTTMSPSTGGTWVSSDPTKATITNSGLVTALAQGTVTLTFTNSSTGCSKDADADLVIYAPPSISITGDDEICIGETTNLSPTFGGAWISNNTAVASISSNGLVTGINAGTVTFTFVETATGCYSEESAPVTVLPAPVVSIDGPNTICAGSTTNLSPSTGGTWTSDNVSVATVSNTGVVTGISQGLARFTFTSTEGCSSSKTSPVIVFDSPNAIINGPSSICIGSTSQMVPSSGGTWTSSDTTVATIDNNGEVTGIAPGTTTFIFTDTNTGCISDPSDPMTVEPNPTTSLIGPSEICIGGTTNMTPLSGGVWTSLNPDIATIENNGEIIGVSNGIAKFIFTDLGTGCVSDTTSGITVLEGIDLTFNGPTNLCIGDTTYILPSTGGTWESNNTSVATITDSGMIISVGSGTVTFKYTDSSTGCVSLPSEALTVNGSPAVSVAGASEICINSETHLSPSSGGTWTSLHPAIASVDANGVVTGHAEGIAYFEFTDDITGCISEDEIAIEVQTAPTIEILDGNTLCLGYTKALSPALAGIWQSSNPDIATISNTGVVTARAPGVVTFSYMDPISGCSTLNDSDPITIVNCTNHDFNVTLKNEVVYGDLNTNDKIDNSAEYGGNINLVSKPLGSVYSLNVNIDGTYSFEADMAGKYVFNVPICLPPVTTGCEGTTLEINVLDNVFVVSSPLANLEYTTTYKAALSGNPGEMVVIDAMANDTCVYGGGCALDPSTLSLVGSPGSGSAVISGSNKIEYTPDADFIGLDTIDYTICMMDGITCTQSQQIIIVNHTSALNSTVANDDFYYTFRETGVSGNVLNNDSDPEGDAISVLSAGSAVSPVIIPEGEYYIESNGQFSFTPADDFVGTLNIVYTICDNQSEPYCADATIHLLVLDDLSLNIRVYLEGALINNGGEETLEGLPLMRDDLRVSPHTGQNYIPTSDPYTFDNDPYAATETMFTKMGPGLLNKNQFITDSLGVFSVEGRDAIVDWVHVEIRSKADSTQILGTRSGLVQRDGDVVDLDGVASLRFQGVNVDSFYVVVKHRSHLGAMSLKVTSEELIDFTDQNFPVYDFGTSHSNGFDYTGLARKNTVVYGYSALWAGDFDSNGKVKFANPDDDQNLLFLTVLFSSPEFLINYDNAYGYYTCDYDMSSKAKYTNPNDDLNYLFSQILLYPLNTSFLSNFSSMIEQVPE